MTASVVVAGVVVLLAVLFAQGLFAPRRPETEPPRARLAPEDSSVAHYRVLGELERGPFAAVYVARDERHRRDVCLKVLYPSADPNARALFVRKPEFWGD